MGRIENMHALKQQYMKGSMVWTWCNLLLMKKVDMVVEMQEISDDER